ncbi:hypothetical protein COU57_04685 [Candidatus Pacearchaeota archaeon CG10_big_fil_rev_8_21_14_0_10_32_14]|nr:MAG: hypothetical protein COU57_04685 [Candidatus Pacearchaeota archaeon CG10_big_fil_rev_8_21_14_0_10_32_14]
MGDVVLLADPKSMVWEFSKSIQKYISTKYYGTENSDEFPLNPIEVKHFRNKEFIPHVQCNVRRKEIYFVQDSTLDPSFWLTELILLKDLLLSASAERVNYVLPNLLWSRQDRKDKPHVPISSRAIAEAISPNLSRIITMDLHAGQIQGDYPAEVPVDNLHSFPVAVNYLLEYHPKELESLVIASPDSGGVSRIKSFSKQLSKRTGRNYPLAFINKYRKDDGEPEVIDIVGDVNKKNVLIIDDMIDSGGTMIEGVKGLKERGAKKVMGYGTHGLFTEGYDKVVKSLDAVITSNTHHITDPRIEIIHVEDLFAEAIYRDYKGKSISELF